MIFSINPGTPKKKKKEKRKKEKQRSDNCGLEPFSNTIH
jgi:hypothetical protein